MLFRSASLRDRYTLRAVRSVFKDEKKLSMAALSQTFPDRLGRHQNLAIAPDNGDNPYEQERP